VLYTEASGPTTIMSPDREKGRAEATRGKRKDLGVAKKPCFLKGKRWVGGEMIWSAVLSQGYRGRMFSFLVGYRVLLRGSQTGE